MVAGRCVDKLLNHILVQLGAAAVLRNDMKLAHLLEIESSAAALSLLLEGDDEVVGIPTTSESDSGVEKRTLGPERAVGNIDVDRKPALVARSGVYDAHGRVDTLECLDSATQSETLLAAGEKRLLDCGVVQRRVLAQNMV